MGFFVDSRWLNAQGISRQLVTKYLKSGWLERAAHGLYRRPVHVAEGDAIELPDWEMLVLSMQHLMGTRRSYWWFNGAAQAWARPLCFHAKK